MTRAFGDSRYKPFVIAEPEILVYNMQAIFEEFNFAETFLVLASDGLWGVITSIILFDTLILK